MDQLVGIGLYTPAEAARLIGVPAGKITRWLRGHSVNSREYPALWQSQVQIGDGKIYLGFLDLIELKVANAFMEAGVSAQRVRAAIDLARLTIGRNHPLSTDAFATDGRSIFLKVVERESDGAERERLLETFRRQYAFAEIINPSLKGVERGDDGVPNLWWPKGRTGKIVVDPARSFGQPIEASSSVPTKVLAAAAKSQGVGGAAAAYDVPEAAIRRAAAFEADLELRRAA